jgi:hypothetical protein
MMIIIFWEMTSCGSYKNRRFGGSYRRHVEVRIIATRRHLPEMIIIIVTAVETSNLTSVEIFEQA